MCDRGSNLLPIAQPTKMASGLIAACGLFSLEEPLPCGAFTLLRSEFQLHTGHARHWSHFPNEQIVFSSSLGLIFEPICAAISSSLFCWPWALSQPHRNYGLSCHWECGTFSHRNDLAEHEEERGRIPGPLSLFLMLVIYKVSSYVLSQREEFPGVIWETTSLWGHSPAGVSLMWHPYDTQCLPASSAISSKKYRDISKERWEQ